MLAVVPPAWVTWLAMTWALCWSLWATVDSWLHPRNDLPLRVCHAVHLLFCVQWFVFLTIRLSGAWTRTEYLEFVAPYAPIVFAAGPWAIWPIKHWFYRRTLRGTMTTGSEISGSS